MASSVHPRGQDSPAHSQGPRRRWAPGPGLLTWRRLFALIFTLILLAAPFFLAVTGLGGTARAEPKTRSEINEELEGAKEEIEDARAGQEQAEATRQRALGDIESLDKQIDSLREELAGITARRDTVESELAATRENLERLSAELRRKREELTRAEADLAEVQQILEARAKNIYKMGELGYLELILDADRLTDLINRFQLLTRILNQDRDLVDQIESLRQRVTEQKTALEEQRRAVVEVERRQEEQKTELDRLVAEREAAEERLEGTRSEKAAILARAEKDKEFYEQQEENLLAESRKLEEELRELERAAERAANTGSVATATGTGEYVWPVSGRISSPFGIRVHPIFGTRKMHTGMDIAAGWGTAISAADSGEVVYAGWRGGYGKTVIVSHGGGMSTLYAHQSSIAVGVGEGVARGEVIGKVGSTGYSTGPHLHFEVRSSGSPVNPMNYL